VRLINAISLLKNWRTNEFKGLEIKTTSVRAFDNKSEVLTEVPAYQYSSAILFPETRTKLPKEMTALKSPSIPTNDDEDADDNETVGC
jgi:hypothetical protein